MTDSRESTAPDEDPWPEKGTPGYEARIEQEIRDVEREQADSHPDDCHCRLCLKWKFIEAAAAAHMLKVRNPSSVLGIAVAYRTRFESYYRRQEIERYIRDHEILLVAAEARIEQEHPADCLCMECKSDRFITAWEAAQICDVQESTIRVWCTRGKLTVAHYEKSREFPQPIALYRRADVEQLARRGRR